jgi:hypothetical protein
MGDGDPFPHRLLFYPEDGGDRFLQNTDTYIPNYTVLHPRRPKISQKYTTFLK